MTKGARWTLSAEDEEEDEEEEDRGRLVKAKGSERGGGFSL